MCDQFCLSLKEEAEVFDQDIRIYWPFDLTPTVSLFFIFYSDKGNGSYTKELEGRKFVLLDFLFSHV